VIASNLIQTLCGVPISGVTAIRPVTSYRKLFQADKIGRGILSREIEEIHVRQLKYHHVDVFAPGPFSGNSLTVRPSC